MAQVTVRRFHFATNFTIGKLLIDGIELGIFTLEDCDREKKPVSPNAPKFQKIKDNTAIPRGTYKLIMSHSARFNRPLPEILNVPEFTGIRIHAGNTDKDTSGCVLLGLTWSGHDNIGSSKLAVEKFIAKIKWEEENTITIE